MQTLLKKLITWLPTNIGAIIGIAQAIVKFVKELCTLFIDIIAPIIPGDGDDKLVKTIRDACNKIDEVLEKIKSFLLGVGN